MPFIPAMAAICQASHDHNYWLTVTVVVAFIGFLLWALANYMNSRR